MKKRFASIASIRAASVAFRQAGIPVTVATLSRKTGGSERTLFARLHGPYQQLAAEIRLTKGTRWNTEAIHALYRTTAEYLREEGGVASPRALAKALKRTESAIYAYMAGHPDLAKAIGLVSNEYEMYYLAYRELISEGRELTRRALVSKVGVHRNTLPRFLRRHPEFLDECPLMYEPRRRRRAR